MPGVRKAMTQRMEIEVLGRRTFLIGAGASVALAAFLADLPALAQEPVRSIDEALKKVLGDATASESGITLEIPEIAENGNTVPFTLSVESPMTDASHVRNAIARFDQTIGVPDDDRKLAFANIKKAARHYGVDMSEDDWKELGRHPSTGRTAEGRRESAQKAAETRKKRHH